MLFVQGRRLQEGGELDRAAELFRQVVDAGGEWAGPAALSLGSIADKQGDPEQARAWWSTAVDDPRAGIITMNNLALVAKRQRDLAEAERWFQRVMAADVERRPMCAAHIGEMHYWQGDRRQASQWYRVTLAESEEPELVGEAAFRTAEFLVDSGEYEPARELLVRAIETGAEPYASSSSNLLRQLATSTVQPPSDVPHRSDAPPSDTPPGN